ncbi:hypothetical protein EJ08DRAFT_735463 [Tothia fuscella]|uniref:t-SNARE coiled-coil homology domain-containing protein n=1 Tax=Tothia fuscella TaxID=1048955 RepID=A0A9P4TX63_9PEZI|nr:hypothetical protein EJ08DRAFT_735463 [Tothia fuscella]
MATTNAAQLFLLADHIKLSLLERQRAISLNLEPNSHDGQISRSLDSLHSGIQSLETESAAWDDPLNPSEQQEGALDQLNRLKQQYTELASQFEGNKSATSTLTKPNNPSLAADFAHAQTKPKPNKSVRFTDSDSSSSPASPTPATGRYAPYHDEPDDEESPDHTDLSNEQIHQYHSGVIAEQDEQLDRLGLSIGRQRELSIQIGSELDDQVYLLEEVDERVDRHQGQLDGATRRLNTFARKARENWSLSTIVVLIIILVLLIVITKR